MTEARLGYLKKCPVMWNSSARNSCFWAMSNTVYQKNGYQEVVWKLSIS